MFGGFLEHLGRAVYEGVYDPGSANADADGLPHGRARRPRSPAHDRPALSRRQLRLRLPLARRRGPARGTGRRCAISPGRVSSPTPSARTSSLALCRKMDWTPMLSVNLGTGTPEEARDWVEYCNCPPGSREADRAGRERTPRAVRREALVPGQRDGRPVAARPRARPTQYAIRAQQAAKMMKDCDRSIETVACGSCTTSLPTYMDWDRQVLEYLGDQADYVSLHRYVGNRDGDTADYLAVGASIDRQIEEMDAACRYVQARRRSARRALLCFDEWNVWYREKGGDGRGQAGAAPARGGLQSRGRPGGRRVPEQLHPSRGLREDREPRADRERHRPGADARATTCSCSPSSTRSR